MTRVTPFIFACIAGPGFAEGFDRPIPQAQSATAEFWFLVASLALIGALYFVHHLVNRR